MSHLSVHAQSFASPLAAARDRYRRADLDSRIDAATPHELVAMLFTGLREALGSAQRASARTAVRLRAVTRALAILDALDGSLDHTRGGSVARALAAVYAQVRALVVAGHADVQPELFGHASSQIAAIHESWVAISGRA